MGQRLHVQYTGRVQGVGFRFTAEHIARKLGLTGWVRNVASGAVEAVAEGEDEALKEFLNEVNRSFGRYIRDADASWSPATGEFKDFTIRF